MDEKFDDEFEDGEPVCYSDEFYIASLVICAVKWTSLRGFCSCGTDAEWGVIYHILRAIDGRVKEPDECVRLYMISRGDSPDDEDTVWGFPHDPIPEFLAKSMESMGFTDHGTTVVWSWLSSKGEAYLKAMDICIDEYCERFGLDKDEIREGPFGFSKFCVDVEGFEENNILMPDWVWDIRNLIATDPDVGDDAIYKLFMKENPGYWDCNSDEHKKKVDAMLKKFQEIVETKEVR